MNRKYIFLFVMMIFGVKLTAMDFLPFATTYEEGGEREARSYEAGVQHEQLADIRYILNSLAYKTFSELLSERLSLQQAMMQVDADVHPLHLVAIAFSDAELINAIHSIRDQAWLWRHFFTRIKRTLDEEVEFDNMRPEYVEDFCELLSLDFEKTMAYVQESDWDALVAYLFETFPRNEET